MRNTITFALSLKAKSALWPPETLTWSEFACGGATAEECQGRWGLCIYNLSESPQEPASSLVAINHDAWIIILLRVSTTDTSKGGGVINSLIYSWFRLSDSRIHCHNAAITFLNSYSLVLLRRVIKKFLDRANYGCYNSHNINLPVCYNDIARQYIYTRLICIPTCNWHWQRNSVFMALVDTS